MSAVTITIKPTSQSTIVKFEADQFLTNHSSYEYGNIDEAKNSPLAQRLFHLPFVKKVYLSGNFVAVERYDIVTWDEVQNEVAEIISEFINSGGKVISEAESSPKVPITVYAESTPNPSVLKFVVNKRIVPYIVEYKSIDEAADSPLATELFHLPFVKQVFMDENYVSITKYDMANWDDITMELREFIRNYLTSGKSVLKAGSGQQSTSDAVTEPQKSNKPLDPVSEQIVQILNEYVRPAVASDGGNIEFRSYNSDTKQVSVVLQGACSGCPSSTFTLKTGIETMLKDMLNDQDLTVEAING